MGWNSSRQYHYQVCCQLLLSGSAVAVLYVGGEADTKSGFVFAYRLTD